MSSTEIFYIIADLMQSTFMIFEIAGNSINFAFITLGFAGFGYWMNLQRKFNSESNVPVEIKDNESWYKQNDGSKKLK